MRTLVTGGAGFIGSHVVRALLQRGRRVRVLHLPNERLDNLHGMDVECVAGDVLDPASVAAAIHGCDEVIHMAAIYALWLPRMQLMYDVNVDGTRHVLQASLDAGVRRVVYTSSIARFGGQGNDRDATERSPFALGGTDNLYAQSKADAHEVALGFVARGLDVVIVAPTGPVGPGDIGPTPTGRLLLSTVNLPVAVMLDSWANVGDVRDIAAGHVLALERGRTGESYLLGHENLRLRDLARLAAQTLGVARPVLSLPPTLLRGAGHGLVWWSEHVSRTAPLVSPSSVAIAELGLRADCTKAVRELGLPQTPIAIAVRDALVWFAERGYVRRASYARKLRALDAEGARAAAQGGA